jgi:crossover junction endodeoxyribonuclease RuvC
MIIVGIDIGLEGAISFYDAEERSLLAVKDMPVDRVALANGATRGRLNDRLVLNVLSRAKGAHAFLERPEARPMRGRDKATGAITLRQPGAAGMLAFGEGYGIVHCACTANGMALTEVRPGIWKRSLGVSGDKDDARRRAMELFPQWADFFRRKKDDGRAESALLALYGARQLGLKG